MLDSDSQALESNKVGHWKSIPLEMGLLGCPALVLATAEVLSDEEMRQCGNATDQYCMRYLEDWREVLFVSW